MAPHAKPIGEMNGWNGRAFRLTIWGFPTMCAVIALLFPVVIWPWISAVTAAANKTETFVTKQERMKEENAQDDRLRAYIELQIQETHNYLRETRIELGGKLDRLDDKLDRISERAKP